MKGRKRKTANKMKERFKKLLVTQQEEHWDFMINLPSRSHIAAYCPCKVTSLYLVYTHL
jgi:hypothetical protein